MSGGLKGQRPDSRLGRTVWFCRGQFKLWISTLVSQKTRIDILEWLDPRIGAEG